MYRVRAGDNARIKEEISVCKIRNYTEAEKNRGRTEIKNPKRNVQSAEREVNQ